MALINQLIRFGVNLAKNKTKIMQFKPYFRGLTSIANSRQEFTSNETELSNGFRIGTQSISGSNSLTTFMVSIDSGSRYETEDTNGISNLFIHSILASNQLTSRLETIGAEIHANTDRDITRLSITCLTKDSLKALEILSNLVLNPNFTETEVEIARKHVLTEMAEMDRNNALIVMNNLHAMAYQKTALALPSIGKSENILRLNRKDLLNYVDCHVKGPRLVLSAAGALDHNLIVSAAEKHFGSLGVHYDKTEIPILAKCRYTGSDIRIRDDSMPVAHIALAVEGAGRDSPDYIGLELATQLMGCWDRTYGGGTDCSSYLGICSATSDTTHSFRSFNTCYAETALFGIELVCDRMKLEEVVWHLTYEWKRFCTEITDNELNRAKNLYLTKIMRKSETSYSIANTIGQQMMSFNRIISLDEWKSRVLALNADKVRRICNDYIWDRCLVVSALGPIEQLEDYEVLRTKLYWFRY